MFKFLKNLFKNNPVENTIINLEELEDHENFSFYRPFNFIFDEYGKCCEVRLNETFYDYSLKIFEREYNHEEYFYLHGSWDNEFARIVNNLLNAQKQRKEREEFKKKTKEEQSVIYFNNKFKKD